jgi:hypothetical protein
VRFQVDSVQKRFAANLALVGVALLSLQVLPQRFGVGVGPFADWTVEGFHDDLRILVAVFVVAVEGAAIEDDFAADVALLALFVDPLACRYYQTLSSLTLRQNNMHWLSTVPGTLSLPSPSPCWLVRVGTYPRVEHLKYALHK